jgi:hypothetical protein
VEIYEEMVRDPQGQLTTSFLSLDDKVKDNRIQPQGRSSSGPNADITASVGTGADRSYQGMRLQRGTLPAAAHGHQREAMEDAGVANVARRTDQDRRQSAFTFL